jgi:hypothetical protein
LILADSVHNGYFDKSKLLDEATKKNQIIISSKSKYSLSKAWDLYHDSFENNQNDVIDHLLTCFMANLEYINLNELNSVVSLLREFKEDEKASHLIDVFIENKKSNLHLFNLKINNRFGDIKDTEIIDKFSRIYHENFIPKTVTQVLSDIAGKNGWEQEDIDMLANTSIDQYYDIFKSLRGKDTSKYINTCLQFGRFSNASEQHKKISDNATEALKRIGSESSINRLRIRKFGIETDNKD